MPEARPVQRSSFGHKRLKSAGIASAVLLAAAILFGGASRQHELRLTLVILASLPLLVFAADAMAAPASRHNLTGLALALLVGAIAIPLVQLIPLPPDVWTNLPGRQELSLALDLAGAPQGWTPLSLTPDRTWRSFLALLPPVAMFLGVLVSPPQRRLDLVKLLVILTLASIVLGVAQMASRGEALYPWRTTDAGNVTGFFANRNHFATLCLIGIPFLGVIAARSSRRADGRGQLWVWLAIAGIALAVVVIGVGVSRAGMALAVPVVLLTITMFWMGTGRKLQAPALALMASSVVGFAVLALFALAPILQRFDSGVREGRFENWPVVLDAAGRFLPTGSGLGSFDAVYRSVEPLERLDATFFNQAHNDYLETWLETGWLGALLIVAFMFWFVRRTWAAWRSGVSTERDLQRAASISAAAVLLHSFVDYPLRTEAIAVVFALCCGVLEMAARSDAELGVSASRTRRRRPV